ncbi:hypothetical protein UA70_14370, partial [Raoultella planticola]
MGQGRGQFFILPTIMATTLRQRGSKDAIIQAGKGKALQQMADPLAAGVSRRRSAAEVVLSLATNARRRSGPSVFDREIPGNPPAPSAEWWRAEGSARALPITMR